jgi:hypothetical protein
MKYVVAFYKNLSASKDAPKVPFGFVLIAGNKVIYKFDSSADKKRIIKELSSSFDPMTFESFARTFHDSYVKPGKTTITDNSGNRREVQTNSEEFLDYLAETSQGPYQYSRPSAIDADNPDQVIDFLSNRLSIA